MESFTITFADSQALAVRAPCDADARPVLDALGLAAPQRVIVVMGGAGGMAAAAIARSRALVEDGLARFAHDQGVQVIDGGTDVGAMGMLGAARARWRFPLIGIAPEALIAYPGHDNPHKIADLDAHHSYFILTDRTEFGEESELIARLASALSAGSRALGVVINGGEVVSREVHQRAVGANRLPMLILEGSGRYADELAAARRAITAGETRTRETLEHGALHFLPIEAGAAALYVWLERFFTP